MADHVQTCVSASAGVCAHHEGAEVHLSCINRRQCSSRGHNEMHKLAGKPHQPCTQARPHAVERAAWQCTGVTWRHEDRHGQVACFHTGLLLAA